MRILVTGTPGTGKTTISLALSKKLGVPYINLNELILASGQVSWNQLSNTFDVLDPEKVSAMLNEEVRKRSGCVCETLAIELLDSSIIDKVVILRRDPYLLWNELQKRGWPLSKVASNVLSELLNVISYAARDLFDGKVIEVDTSKSSPDECIDTIIRALNGEAIDNEIDWLSRLDNDKLMDFIQTLEEMEGRINL
ncbi:MAG: AAA family ATPase [Thermocladium sp.]